MLALNYTQSLLNLQEVIVKKVMVSLQSGKSRHTIFQLFGI